MRYAQALKREKPSHPPKRPRQMDNPRTMWGFRPTDEVASYIDEKTGLNRATKERRIQLSAQLVEMLEFYMHFDREIGGDIWELRKRAEADGLHAGAEVARLIRSALKKK